MCNGERRPKNVCQSITACLGAEGLGAVEAHTASEQPCGHMAGLAMLPMKSRLPSMSSTLPPFFTRKGRGCVRESMVQGREGRERERGRRGREREAGAGVPVRNFHW